MTLGAFTALWLSQPAQFIPGGQDLPFIWALLITLLIGTATGARLELVLFRPLRKQQVGTKRCSSSPLGWASSSGT